jgi:hypothetical protein
MLACPINMKLAVATVTLWPKTENSTLGAQSAPGASPSSLMHMVKGPLPMAALKPIF